jgi:uncharacterized protein
MQSVEQRESVVLENEGQKIFGILHTPLHRPSECPAVLICHGLAGHKTGKYRIYVKLAQQLAREGIVSLRIDFRGSGDSEGDFSQVTLKSEVSDALIAIEYLKRLSCINPQRIGLFGRSVGGSVALMAANQASVASLGLWAPLFDGHQWVAKWNYLHSPEVTEEQRMNMMRVNGQVPSDEFFHQLFEMNMQKFLKPLEQLPLLHIHGERDEVVTPEHAKRFEKARQNAEGHTQFIRFPESDHDFSHFSEQKAALEQTCNWFASTL